MRKSADYPEGCRTDDYRARPGGQLLDLGSGTGEFVRYKTVRGQRATELERLVSSLEDT
jgi:hypothetical protein